MTSCNLRHIVSRYPFNWLKVYLYVVICHEVMFKKITLKTERQHFRIRFLLYLNVRLSLNFNIYIICKRCEAICKCQKKFLFLFSFCFAKNRSDENEMSGGNEKKFLILDMKWIPDNSHDVLVSMFHCQQNNVVTVISNR